MGIYYLFQNLQILQPQVKMFQPRKFIAVLEIPVSMQKPGVFGFFKRSQELQKIFEIAGTFFQVVLSTIFYGNPGIFNETFLTWRSLACNIFSKQSWFLFLDKSQVQKSGDVISCFFGTVKKEKFRCIQAHSCNSFRLSPHPSLLHLMNRYTTSTGGQILKRKGIEERKLLISVNYSV